MKAAFLALSSVALLPSLATAVESLAPTPFVETTTLTFYWGFSSSYISNAGTAVPALPDDAVFDPDALPTGFETYTDTLRARAYTGPSAGSFPAAGANRQIINLLLQRMVREGYLIKEDLDYRWQLTAVREAPANVEELATNPYRIFLTGQPSNFTYSYPIVPVLAFGEEDGSDAPMPVFWDTGLTLTLGGFAGNYTETNWGADNNKVRNASGSVSTAFTIDFGALFYEDPKHGEDEPESDPEFNYHLKRNYWQASATGLINYGIRSISGPLPTFIASTAKATGTGWFLHNRLELEYDDGVLKIVDDPAKTYTHAGLAPLRVTMSTIQYQKRTVFYPHAPSTLAGNFDVGTTSVNLTWQNRTSFGTDIVIERREGAGAWTQLVTLEPNDEGVIPESYSDTTVSPDSSYSYRVQAVDLNGPSLFSNIVTVSTVGVVP
jgi:hypothetical protein